MPGLLKALAPAHVTWSGPADTARPAVYLTFDDGPHPKATSFVLQQLAAYEAQATFFCLGKNVLAFPQIYQDLLGGGHQVGNHTHNHVKGWSSPVKDYVNDVLEAGKWIDSKLFRPPYGRMKRMQARVLQERGFRIVMWSLLSGDFDTGIDGKACLENVIFHLKPGDIVVFHDSEKAWERMSYALPRVLAFCADKGWAVRGL